MTFANLVKRWIGPKGAGAIVLIRDRVISGMASGLALFINLMPARLRIALGKRTGVVVPLDYPRADIRLHASTILELRGRARSCLKEPETIEWIEGHLRSSDVLYDIGANVGAYSFVANAYVKGEAQIFAFEPGYETFNRLCQNIHLNRAGDNIVPCNVALSDGVGFVTFRFAETDPGAASHGQDGAPVREGVTRFVHSQRVLGFTLDRFVETFRLPLPNLIKIDVDGPDLEILRGARTTLASPSLRTVLIEVEPASIRAQEIEQLLSQLGFRVTSRHDHGNGCANWIFIRGEPDKV